MSESHRGGTPGENPRARVLALLVVSIVVQALAIYYPGTAQPGGPVGFDKLVHCVIFGVPAALAVLAGGAWRRWAPPLLIGHAVISELVQATVIPDRTGDPMDVLGDVLGVVLGWVVARRFAARTTARLGAHTAAGRSATSAERPGGSVQHGTTGAPATGNMDVS